MQMNMGLAQKQTTQLVMTTELRTAISLLQFSVLELADYIHEQSMNNPLIDLDTTFSKENIIDKAVKLKEKNVTVSSSHANSNFSPIDDLHLERKTIYDSLLYQARMLSISSQQRYSLEKLIYSLDDNGYLPADFTENETEEEKNVLQLLQEMEPAGVGARSLQECLLIQLRSLPEQYPLAESIVQDHFEPFSAKNWNTVAKSLSITLQDIQQVHDLIQTLNPRPGSAFNEEITNYIIPEVYLVQHKDEWEIVLNEDCVPAITLQDSYLNAVEDKQSEDYLYIKKKFEEYKQIQQSLQQRNSTLFKTAEAIVLHQQNFFLHGTKALKPLTLRQIAEDIDVHESTISRITTNKYMATPKGIYELKYFFTSGLQSDDQEQVSSSYLKELIQQFIDQEDKLKPLSDQDIASKIEKLEKIAPSRRVIAKYRNELQIPSSSKRKRFTVIS